MDVNSSKRGPEVEVKNGQYIADSGWQNHNILEFKFFFFIYLGCTGSSLQQTGSFVAAHGIFSSGTWAS